MYRPCLHCEGKKYDEAYCPEICTYGEARKLLKELENAASALVVHGRWIRKRSPQIENCFICSNCKEQVETTKRKLNFCPECGAKMDLEEG